MLAAGEKMFAYTFKGYWKDVGTINSLFESNMDLLNRDSELDINDPTWKIRSRNPIAPPQYIGENGRAVNSVVVSGCEIEEFDIYKYRDEYVNAEAEDKVLTYLGKFTLAAMAQKSLVTNRIFKSGNRLAGRSIDYDEKGFSGIKDFKELIAYGGASDE